MIYRVMEEADLDFVVQMEQEIFSTPWSKESFRESLTKDYSHFFVAEEEQCIVAYLGIHNLGGDGEITNVAVNERYRGRHIAFALMQYAMEETKQKGVEAFTLEVRKSNLAAICLYKKLGFLEQGIRKNFYENPMEDAIIMWKY